MGVRFPQTAIAIIFGLFSLFVGDSGGVDYETPVTPQQKQVAEVMKDLANEKPVNFILGLGDNFYPRGVGFVHYEPSGTEEHWTWIETKMAQSDADYIFVGGHYPIYSVGPHGSSLCLITRLDKILRSNGVSVYFSGHDHNLQHLTKEGHQGPADLHYVVSGMGALTSHGFEIKKPYGVSIAYYSGLDTTESSHVGLVMSDVTAERSRLQFMTTDDKVLQLKLNQEVS